MTGKMKLLRSWFPAPTKLKYVGRADWAKMNIKINYVKLIYIFQEIFMFIEIGFYKSENMWCIFALVILSNQIKKK